MKKYILYVHGGSKNHGCEALVRTTTELLKNENKEIVLVSYNPDQDILYGIDKLCTIVPRGATGKIKHNSYAFIKAYWNLKFKNNYKYMDYLLEASSANARKGDVALSIGGDTYCYSETDYIMQLNEMWRYTGLKTVYWGCSIEPELLDVPEIAYDIKKYDLITARESISYEALKKINPNTILVADSAFLLNKVELPLPTEIEGHDFVGINTSPLVEECENSAGIVRENVCRLIENILSNTDMSILLIPHVIWQGVDDRTVLQALYRKYETTKRVVLLEDHNCEELKGFISRCRFFVGARTHATIAAYSTGVPTLVLGYSVKSRGIAKDLFGTSENYVVSAQDLKNRDDLSKAFNWLVNNELEIKERLNKTLPNYKKSIYDALKALKSL